MWPSISLLATVSVACEPSAFELSPKITEPFVAAVIFAPIATVFLPFTFVLRPIATESTAAAFVPVDSPNAIEPAPCAPLLS